MPGYCLLRNAAGQPTYLQKPASSRIRTLPSLVSLLVHIADLGLAAPEPQLRLNINCTLNAPEYE